MMVILYHITVEMEDNLTSFLVVARFDVRLPRRQHSSINLADPLAQLSHCALSSANVHRQTKDVLRAE